MAAGAWEPHTFVLLDQHLRADKVFVDIGAWVGPLALYACTKPDVRVVALEPDTVALARLRRNLALNGPTLHADTRVAVEDACLAPADGTVRFGNPHACLVRCVGAPLAPALDRRGLHKGCPLCRATACRA